MLNAVVNEKDGWIIIRPNNNIEFRSLTRDLFSLLLVIDCDRIINLMIFFLSHTWRDCVPIGPFKNDLDVLQLCCSLSMSCTRTLPPKIRSLHNVARRINELLSLSGQRTARNRKDKKLRSLSLPFTFSYSLSNSFSSCSSSFLEYLKINDTQ